MVAHLPDAKSEVEPLPARPPHRPAPHGDGFGRWLRARIGVDEETLRWAPEVRPHYTKIGLLVLTTSVLAAASMLTALVKFVDVYWLLLVPIAAFWGWVIFVVDSWLITTMHGSQKVGGAFWLRLVLAALLGLIIAEPLLLKVFEPAIHRQVAATRTLEYAARQSSLKACNPVPYRELNAAEHDKCNERKLLLTVPSDPAGISVDIDTKQRERDLKQTKLDADKKTLQKLRDTAGLECNGHKGQGLSGVFGNGPRCKDANQNAETFPAQNRLDERQQEINLLGDKINELIDRRNAVERDYADEMNQAIKAQLPPMTGDIGLPEEHKALGVLSSQSGLVLAGSWLLRLLLVVLDCLPVASKRLAGPTPYDRMITRRLAVNEEIFELDNELLRQRDRMPREKELSELNQLDRARQWDRDVEEENVRIRQDKELNRRIDEYARRLRGET
jgi:hypothetical protein